MELNTEEKMISYMHTLKYLVIFPDKKIQVYKCLRAISKDICIDPSTISKKLKSETGNTFIAKGTGFIFWIQKL